MDDTINQSKTQRAAILRLLIEARGAWVPLPEIMACAAQYNARVLELRRLGFHVENKTERVNGARHSWFRLVDRKSTRLNSSHTVISYAVSCLKKKKTA